MHLTYHDSSPHTSVLSDPSSETGAPAIEIEITPEMIAAGSEVLWRSFSDEMPWGSTSAHGVAAEVYQAMVSARSGGYSEKEAASRRDATIKRMIAMPPKPHSEMKIGKVKKKKTSEEIKPKKRTG